MNARNYDLDTAAAKEANSGGKRITEHGTYTGQFIAAWYECNQNGTESVKFIFASEGQEAGPLALYTHNGKGEELPSYKMLNAIMCCLKVKRITTKDGTVKLYDFDSKQEVIKQKDIYPELIGKPIGLVLTSEEYRANNGDIKTRLNIAAPFHAETKRMANEVLSGASDAVDLSKFTDWLTNKNKWIKRLPQETYTPPYDGHGRDDDPFGDDIP